MFCCPRSSFCINNCTQCSLLYVDWRSDSNYNLVDSIQMRYKRYFPKGSLTDEVEGLFLKCTAMCLDFNVVYEPHLQYENIVIEQVRCLEFYLVDCPAKLLQLYLEILFS